MYTPKRMNIPHRMNPPPQRMNAPNRPGGMFPHTVTVYNTVIEYDDSYNETLANHITILRGVLMQASLVDNVRTTGDPGADSVILYIPHNVTAVDGVTGKKRKYARPMDFWKMDDHSEYWTLSGGREGNKDTATFFIKGEVVEPERDRAFLESSYDDVYSVTKVDHLDFGGLPHFEVGGV